MRLLGQPGTILLVPGVRAGLPHLLADDRLPLDAYHGEKDSWGLGLAERMQEGALRVRFAVARTGCLWWRRRRGQARALDVLPFAAGVRALPSVVRADGGPAAHVAVDGRGAELAVHDGVEDRLEVIQEDGVARALEDEGEAPVRVYAGGGGEVQGGDEDVGDEEGDAEEHAQQHDAEAGVDAAEGEDLEAVRLLDGVDQLPRREDPPRVAHERFPGPHALVGVRAQAVEVGEVGPRLGHPEGLDAQERDDVQFRAPGGEEGPDLQPGDDVVQEVGDEEQGRSGGEVPAVVRVVDEDEGAVPEGEHEFEEDELVQPYPRAVVAEDDEDEDDQAADVVALRPGLEEAALRGEAVAGRWGGSGGGLRDGIWQAFAQEMCR